MTNLTQKNYYDTLNVQPQATTEEIVSMYRKLVKKYHADTRHEYDQIRQKELISQNGAYDPLSDAVERAQEVLIRTDIRRCFLIVLALMTIMFLVIYPSYMSLSDKIVAFFKTLIQGYLLFQIHTWIVRLVAHGLKSNLLSIRGYLANGTVAIFLLIIFFSVFMEAF